MTKQTVLLGAHVSIAGGINEAYYRGASIHCTAIQFFTHSNRQWAIKPLTAETIKAADIAKEETGITHVIVHASYLINLCSQDAETRKKAKNMLKLELEHCANLGITHLVLHPGSNPSEKTGIKLIAEGIEEILERDPSSVMILLENMAGQGNSIGSRFEQLAAIREGIKDKERIGFCIDTCHLWAGGYDFSTEKGYIEVWHEFDTILGKDLLKAIHLNDSKQKLDSHVDRHANIGDGTIGMEAFTLIMNDPTLVLVPKVLETPGKELSDYAHNMKILLDLIGKRL